MKIDDELASYLRPGPFSVIVASCDDHFIPETVRGWAPKLMDDRETIEVFLGRLPAEKLVANLHSNAVVSMAIANVTTYQAIQVKGHFIEIGEPEPDDRPRVQIHVDAFVAGLQLMGISPNAARGIAASDVVRLRFLPETLFDQTPGPGAGSSR